jgi:hypothetical protein
MGFTGVFNFLCVSFSSLFFLSPFTVPFLGLGIEKSDVPNWAASLLDRIKDVWVAPYGYLFENFPLAS